MAQTQVGDAVVPELYADYFIRETTEKAALFKSGAVQPSSFLDNFISGGGSTTHLPHWNPPPDTDDVVGSDDPTALGTPDMIDAGEQVAVRLHRTKSWKVMGLTRRYAGSDPFASLVSSGAIQRYWENRMQSAALSTLEGLRLLNEAAGPNQFDMIARAGGLAAGAGTGPAAPQLIDMDTIVDAKYTFGDAEEDTSILICHSAVAKNMEKQSLLSYVSTDFPAGSPQVRASDIPYSGQRIGISSTLGLAVIKDDRCPQFADGAGGVAYVSYLMAPGFLQYGESVFSDSVETERKPSEGDDTGADVLYNRRDFVLHPSGYAYIGASNGAGYTAAGGKGPKPQFGGPSNAVLGTAASWKQEFPRKQIGAAFVISNG